MRLATFLVCLIPAGAVTTCVTTASLQGATIFESGTLGPTGVSSEDVFNQVVVGANVDSNAFNGVRFHIASPVMTSQVGGHFVGSAEGNGQFFGAVIELDGSDDFPDSIDLTTPDVVGTTLLSFPDPSEEVFGELELLLKPGWYALLFGSGLASTSGDGAALLNNFDVGSPDYIGFLRGFGWGDRLPGKRFVVEGTFVPEPTGAFLLIIGWLHHFARGRVPLRKWPRKAGGCGFKLS